MNKNEVLRNLLLERRMLDERAKLLNKAARIVNDYNLQGALAGSQISALVQQGERCWEKVNDYLSKQTEKCAENEKWRKRHKYLRHDERGNEIEVEVELKERLSEVLKDKPQGELAKEVDDLAKEALEELREKFPTEPLANLADGEKSRLWRCLKQEFLHFLLACYQLEPEEVQRCQELY